MADITKCIYDNCPKKDCYRLTAVDSSWQSWSDFSEEIKSGKECSHYYKRGRNENGEIRNNN